MGQTFIQKKVKSKKKKKDTIIRLSSPFQGGRFNANQLTNRPTDQPTDQLSPKTKPFPFPFPIPCPAPGSGLTAPLPTALLVVVPVK